MAEKYFTIENPANPIRLVKIESQNRGKYYYINPDTSFAYDAIPDFQSKLCYHQKYTTEDKPKLQVLSDYDNIYCKLYNIDTGLLEATFTWVEINTNILNQTFKCYEVEIDFSLIQFGNYQLVVYYYDTDPAELVYYYSEPINLQEIQEDTILLEYTNSYNDFSLVFDNQFKGIFRVESAILNFKPASDDVIYNDQERNSSTLYSLPYKQYQFFLGDSEGLPDWVVDRVNRMFSFNILSLDGVYYNKLEGSKFEEKRESTLYPFSGQVIDIIPVENGFQEKINTDALIPTSDEMIQYQKVVKYLANGSDISIENRFKNLTLLARINIVNRSGSDFDINIATVSTGSADDIDFDLTVTGITQTFVINQLFSENKTLNITGLDGIDCDIIIDYIDYLATASGTPNAYFALGKSATVIYTELEAGFYDIDFNFATGLGREDTDWFGWAIADGRNGTQDFGGLIPIGFKEGDADFSELNDTLGSRTKTISRTNLPNEKLKLFADQQITVADKPTNTSNVAFHGSFAGGNDYFLRRSTIAPTLGNTDALGDGTALDVLNPVKVSLYVTKIAD